MPIKKVFTSEKLVYRTVINAAAFGGISYFSFSAVDSLRTSAEYISLINGLSMARNPNNSTEFKIYLHTLNKQDPWPSWGTPVYQFNSVTGAFEGVVEGVGNSLTVREIVTDIQGAVWGWHLNFTFVKLNLQTGLWEETGKGFGYFGANVGSFRLSSAPYFIDTQRDRFVTRIQGDAANSVSICEYSTGDFLYRVPLCGRAEALFAVDASRAYAISEDGTVTVFDYITGAVLGAFHSGITQNINNQAWAWDPQLRRILHCRMVPDTLPDGVCNVLINGYYPLPLALGMTPPIPLKPPRKGVTVPVYCRTYGGAGEGIPGQEVSFSVTTSPDASVAPNRRNTADNGVAKTFLTGALAGANGITATTEVPDAQ